MNRITSICWCGDDGGYPAPHSAYVVCPSCGTARLMDASFWSPEVLSGDQGIYGKEYWYEHQERDLSFPNIDQRAIDDLPHRCLHWLDLFLRFVSPRCNVLEVGCGHGGLLKLLSMAGYETHGLEVNEEIVQMGRDRFGCDIRCGQVTKDLILELGVDVVAMFDVLEHVPDPVSVLNAVASGSRRDLVCLIQTPCMRDDRSPDWLMFKPPEHLYLYTEQSITKLLEAAGFTHIRFEPALFGGDMQVIASPNPLREITPDEQRDALLTTPDGRVIYAMLQLKEETDRLVSENRRLTTETTMLKNQRFRSRLSRLLRGKVSFEQMVAFSSRVVRRKVTTD